MSAMHGGVKRAATLTLDMGEDLLPDTGRLWFSDVFCAFADFGASCAAHWTR